MIQELLSKHNMIPKCTIALNDLERSQKNLVGVSTMLRVFAGSPARWSLASVRTISKYCDDPQSVRVI